jgi:ubiquinone/menaquinone biosynthesis C-methylase UbiE
MSGIDLNKEMKWWENQGGIDFLKRIGIKQGFKIADFGCRIGHYVIPAAKLVKNEGKVIAVDKDAESLKKLQKRAKQENLNNIEIVETAGELKIPVDDNSMDAVLLYDVMHLIEDMEKLICDAKRALKSKALLSVYPSHYENANPKQYFKGVSLDQIIEKIEKCGFSQKERFSAKISHFDHLKEDEIFNFTAEN